MFLQIPNLLLAVVLFGLLHLVTSHDVLDLAHDMVDLQCDADREGHLVGVVYAHPQQPLHGFELLLIRKRYHRAEASLLIYELDDSARHVLPLTVHWADQEVAHLSRRTLVVNLVLELSLLGGIIGDIDLSSLEDKSRQARVAREVHELPLVEVSLRGSFSVPLSVLVSRSNPVCVGRVIHLIILSPFSIFGLLFSHWGLLQLLGVSE